MSYQPPSRLPDERALLAEFYKISEALKVVSMERDRLRDRRGTTVSPQPGDAVRVQAGDTVLMPSPRNAQGRVIRVIVESQPVTVVATRGEVDGAATQTLTSTGARFYIATGEAWWSGPGGSAGAPGPTGPTGPTGATGPAGADSAFRQLQRFVWYTNGDREEYDGDNTLVTTTTSSTLALADLDASARMIDVWVVPSGSSGGTGARGTTNAARGGSGAGGPDIGHEMFSIEKIAPLLPITVTVGAAPAAATGTAAGRTVVLGADGNTGNPSSFGSLLSAYPGGPGLGGSTTNANGGGTGGGSHGPGLIGSTATAIGGAPATDTDKNGIGHAGAGSHSAQDATGIGSSGRCSECGGASGGGSTIGTNVAARGGHGGNSNRGGPGAGGGGGAATADRAGGGNGGGIGYRTDGSLSGNGVTGPAFASGQGSGTDGTDGANGSVLTLTPGQPGSGGAACRIDSGATSFTSGRGGHGGFPGGSSGGSGSGFVNGGTGNLTIAASGTPAAGVVVAVVYG